MIFDTVTSSSAINWDAVQESAYPLGLEGGLMHVYENECNYNAIMKAAGLSELKYYKENGGDLFVQEAGAAGSLIDRFIAFFKKVIEKIKQIFKKFVMVISSYVSKDKDFVKKYKPMVFKNFKEFKFTGWDFESSKGPNTNRIPIGTGSADDIAKKHPAVAMTDDNMEEFMFMGLRMIRGVCEKTFEKKFGVKIDTIYKDVIDKHINEKLLVRENGRIYLTAKGIELSNYVMSDFILT